MERLHKKSLITIWLLATCMFLSKMTLGQTPGWYLKMKQIKVFQSTRQQVERLFKISNKKETSGNGPIQDVYYDIDGARLSVGYSTGRCVQHPSTGYDLDRDIVVGISVYSMKDIKVSDFDFDLNHFESHKESDNNAIIWTNYDLGIQLGGGMTPNGTRLVKSIEISPRSTEKERLNCNKN